MNRVVLAVVSLLLAAGCDPVGRAEIDVVLPAALLADPGVAYPVQVLAESRFSGNCADRLVALCADPGDDVRFTWEADGGVCPGERTIRFWIAPAPGVTCAGPLPERVSTAESVCDAVDKDVDPVAAEITIFTRGDCNEGLETHEVTLVRPGG